MRFDRAHFRSVVGPGAGPSSGTTTLERVADPSPNPLELVWHTEWEKAALGIALERLKRRVKARHFQVFYLHVIKQQKPGEVAKALGVSAAQVYLVKCRLLPMFKRILKEIERRPL
jgi:RNA polymerase sigma-70 factor (ECF subfamily)